MITIRRIEPSDRAEWERLFREYMTFYERVEPQAMYDRAWTEFTRDDRMHALVACIDDRLVGIVHYLVHANTSAKDVCYLQDLFTAADVRKQGVATALIDAVVEQARAQDCSRVYWTTHETNHVARRLYDRVGEYRGFIRYQIQINQ